MCPLNVMAEGPVDVQLWAWPLDTDDMERARLAAFLSAAERQRASRFAFDRDRYRFTVARGRLRDILGAHLSRAPGSLSFDYSPHEKPSLAGGPNFNLSHSDGLAVLALCDEFPLGIDVERVRPLKEDVAERYFAATEISALRRLSPSDQLAGFYRCWTRKEAVVKAIGDGLSRPLDSFAVSVNAEPAQVERIDGDHQECWRLANLQLPMGYVGAVACRTGHRDLSLTHVTRF
jgi:4'-phosphopantetheinyl transferase